MKDARLYGGCVKYPLLSSECWHVPVHDRFSITPSLLRLPSLLELCINKVSLGVELPGELDELRQKKRICDICNQPRLTNVVYRWHMSMPLSSRCCVVCANKFLVDRLSRYNVMWKQISCGGVFGHVIWEGEITIYIHTMSASMTLFVRRDEEISTIKKMISAKWGWGEGQPIIWAGKKLEGCLSDYHIQSGTTLFLSSLMRGD